MKLFQKHSVYLTLILLGALTTLNAQIPINGFCKYVNVDVDSSFKNVLTLNFNGDSYTDLLVYNQSNKIISYQGSNDYGFSKSNTTNLRFDISLIKPFNRKKVNNQYAFISRKDRRVGVLEVTTYGYCRIITELKLDSYPENLSVNDIDNEGSDELLVSGSAFDGLSVFYFSNRQLSERKVLSKRLFSNSVFIDLNNDSYQDIAAVDLLQNKLVFFYNNSAGYFAEIRSFTFPFEISFLQSVDFNLDGYYDLCVAGKNNIEVLFGDAFAKYDKKRTVNTTYEPKKIITADFNKDGLIDIAYLDKANSIVSVLFSYDDKKFYPEMSYLQKDGLSDISLFYSKFVSGFLSYSKTGKLHIVDRLRRITDNTNLVFGINPTTIKYFDAGNDKIYDLCFFDKENGTLNLVIRNSSGIPEKLYRIKVEKAYKNLAIDESASNKKTFYCYSSNERFIEIVNVNFQDNSITKDKLYTVGPITDLRIKQNPDEERSRIYVLSNKNNNLSLSIFYFKDFRYSVSNSNVLAKNIWNAKLSLEDQLKIYYWTNDNNAFVLNKVLVNNDLKVQQLILSYKIEIPGVKSLAMLVGDFFNHDRNDAVSFLSGAGQVYAVVSAGEETYKIKLNGDLTKLNLNNENLFNLFEMRFNGLNKIFSVSDDYKTLNKIEILNRKRILISFEVLKTRNIQSYFIKNLNFKNYHFVYIDRTENCITIKEVS